MPNIARVDLRVPVPSPDGSQPGWEIAATVYLPAADALAGRPPLLVLMPGGGYSRRYFDLALPGHSQAGHHTQRGTVVVAIDHLGAGDSSLPPPEVTTLPTVAAADHAAVVTVAARLRAGTLAPGIPPVDLGCVVGAGHSIGGHVLTAMQAGHRAFDGVAILGSGLAQMTIPVRHQAPRAASVNGAAAEQARPGTEWEVPEIDWAWAFHWQDTPVPPELAALIAADIAAGLPTRQEPSQATSEWATASYPGFAAESVLPGAVADEAARIDVPVLLAMGERDVCRPLAEEVAALKSASDIGVLVAPRMAHMHNFAATRALLWERLDEFVTHVTCVTTPEARRGFDH
jgi:pimeloyl-ACP methyl ester carboxylesterase